MKFKNPPNIVFEGKEYKVTEITGPRLYLKPYQAIGIAAFIYLFLAYAYNAVTEYQASTWDTCTLPHCIESKGNVGLALPGGPSHTFDVTGPTRHKGQLYDYKVPAASKHQVMASDGNGWTWVELDSLIVKGDTAALEVLNVQLNALTDDLH